jgi:hypothetical protein
MTRMIKKISCTIGIIFCLSNCTQSSYILGNLDTKMTITEIIMPDQKCNEKKDSRVLVGEKILHPAHKECYYK